LKFGHSKEVTLTDLRNHYVSEHSKYQGKNKSNDKITFLNACGTAEIQPMSMNSFPKLFRKYLRHKGFIGPEYLIPDSFACEFSKIFYSNLLRINDLWEALFKTRWFFVKKYNNLLGLFYTIYADPSIRLSKTVDSVNV
jgi:hypothetical protein